MKLDNATDLDRKSGVAQWRDLLFLFWFSRALFRPLKGTGHLAAASFSPYVNASQ